MDIEKKFESGKNGRTYRRIDPEYKVDIFLGYNDAGQLSMVIAEPGKETTVKSSKYISTSLSKRKDGKLSLSFNLLDSAYEPMFAVFCKDMIVVCEQAGRERAISTALKRWKYWKDMFGKKSSQQLDINEIKGLIGELCELKNRLIPKYGYKEAIKNWMGPLLGHKDFEFASTWYEVKTINDGAVQVIISSLEQLESDIEGHLIVTRLDKTSVNNEKAINLNKLVQQIADIIDDPEMLDLFRTKLDNVGYSFDPSYDSFNYILKGSDIYLVNDSFPRLQRCNINNAIGNAKYTIILAGITNYKE